MCIRDSLWTLVAAAVALSAVFGSLAYTQASDRPAVLTTALLAGEVPVASARQAGQVIMAALADRTWLSQPEALRRKQLEDMLARAGARGATVLVLTDSSGDQVALSRILDGQVLTTFTSPTPRSAAAPAAPAPTTPAPAPPTPAPAPPAPAAPAAAPPPSPGP